MNKKIYIHIGIGKTGSSSLQTFLSFNPVLQTSDPREKILYCSFNKDGGISFGKKLTDLAESSPLKYVSSFPKIANVTNLSKTKSELANILSDGYTPIFSQEDWGRRSAEFKKSNFFSELGCSAHVIIYVRPQVEWFNSAWWQWFAWYSEFSSPEDVVSAWGYNFMLWADQISKWKNLPGVENVRVRLQPQDIVADFMTLVGISKTPEINYPARNNVSLSPTLIKLLLRHPEIRGVHDAKVDIILSKLFKFDGKTPWVIEKQLIGEVMDATRINNLKLLSMLDEQSMEVMKNDPRWWNPDFYANYPFTSKSDLQLNNHELLAIVDQATPLLIKLAGEKIEHDRLITRLNQAEETLKHILYSTSWRLTKPIRFLGRQWKRLLHIFQ